MGKRKYKKMKRKEKHRRKEGRRTLTEGQGRMDADGRSTFVWGISPNTNVPPSFVPISLYWLGTNEVWSRYKCLLFL
jgi:hypothetical protein